MKCSKCKKNYKDTIPTCPKCGEVNHKMLEDKTIAIQEINEDLSLTGLISNQIEEFNEEEVKVENKVKKTKKKKEKNNKKILNIFLGVFVLIVFLLLCGFIYFRNTEEEYDYVNELNLIMEDYKNIQEKTELYDVLAYVVKDDEKIEMVHTNVYDSITKWVSNYKKKEYRNVDDFEENTQILKDNIQYIFDIEYKKIALLEYEEYEGFIKDINQYFNDGKIYYEGIGYYNGNYYNEAYATFDAISEDNQFYKKAIKYKDKVIEAVLVILNNDIDNLKSNIKENSSDSDKLEIYLEIENVIIVYDDIYSNLNLSENEKYQSILEKYKKLTHGEE